MSIVNVKIFTNMYNYEYLYHSIMLLDINVIVNKVC